MPKDQKKKRKRPVLSGPLSGATITSPAAPQERSIPSATLTAKVRHGMTWHVLDVELNPVQHMSCFELSCVQQVVMQRRSSFCMKG